MRNDLQERKVLYAAVWRWHFYAGLSVAPFLMLLAVTGLVEPMAQASPSCPWGDTGTVTRASLWPDNTLIATDRDGRYRQDRPHLARCAVWARPSCYATEDYQRVAASGPNVVANPLV